MQVKCAYIKCMCAVPEGKEYCSLWCEKNAAQEKPPCWCGHRNCDSCMSTKRQTYGLALSLNR